MPPSHLDVVIVGAGLSGVGTAVHIRKICPELNLTILEGRTRPGGTWDLFRYPGIRSDSDMYTLGYSFKPWTHPKAIADGPSIRAYIEETIVEQGLQPMIQYQQKVLSADWDSARCLWRLRIRNGQTGRIRQVSCRFLIGCCGYYRYEHGYDPDFPEQEQFQGLRIHPQLWPEDLDYRGKKVVVIGSGATAVTLVPAMAEHAEQVTMLQRSPTYVASVPGEDRMAQWLMRHFPDSWVYQTIRTRNILFSMGIYQLCQKAPQTMRRLLLQRIKRLLPNADDIRHFSPSYNPWDQRLCAVPDGDLFSALRSGKAHVVTGSIRRFYEHGIELQSGEQLEADIIVTATGLDIQILGGIELKVDGKAIDPSEKMYYKGAMVEDVPNFAMVFGYTNSSWTLKADLIGDYVARLIHYMNNRRYLQCTPRNQDKAVGSLPFIQMSSGYIQRALNRIPRQGDRAPWRLYQNYIKDWWQFKKHDIDDGILVFSHPVHVDNAVVSYRSIAEMPG